MGRRRSVRVKTVVPTWRILAVLAYEADADEADADEVLFGRHQIAASGVGEVIRPLDGYGCVVLEPGEGVLVGLVWGVPLWWIDADRVARAFERRGSIVVSDGDRLTRRADKWLTRDGSRCIPPGAPPA
jgi:hypothetical protein